MAQPHRLQLGDPVGMLADPVRISRMPMSLSNM